MYGMGFIGVRWWFLLLQLNILVRVARSLDRKIFQECYGSMWDNYLTATCDTGQVISIISLKVFAKRRDTGCPQEETAQTPLPSDSCCRYNINDCGDTYLGDGLAHYLSCNGRQDCTGIPIAWMDTPCHDGQHLNKTNYMRMEYECIPSRVIADLTENVLITDNAVHVRNPKYPDGNTFQPGTTMTCSVQASPQTRIVVTAIFLKFIQLQVATGVCGQRVTIEDGTEQKEISCESNNNYNITDVYISSFHSIKFKVFSNALSNRDWRFWFKFKGVNPNSQISLKCGSQTGSGPSNSSTESPTPMSTTLLQPLVSTTTTPHILLIAISVPLAVILIIATVVIILCCKKNIAEICGCSKGAIHPLLSEIGNEDVEVDTEDSRLPIELEIKTSEEEKRAKQKERERRKKEKKRKKHESELRFLDMQQRMNEKNRFRVAGYAASAFHRPVMRPYYPESGQENYYILDHNMYDQQLPLTGAIYGYPAGQNLNFQNNPPAGIQLSATSLSTGVKSKNTYVPPTSLPQHPSAMSVSQRASEAPLIFHTGQFGGQFVPQGSVYEPYENPALRQWRVAGMAATFASHPRAGRPTVEIVRVDNPNESERNQSYDDSIV